ncbi:hypothetical protein BV898_16524 [Hypsibius exemplaris]|uniref:Cadherin domain-containing protein n=1 Tax=Hypsibius exemplaris TaxID=2072580 RepID=A0A9X6NKC4_HYPEX|nr:hypothetical protein BV898_16524 [Hypsibius exemplaris]
MTSRLSNSLKGLDPLFVVIVSLLFIGASAVSQNNLSGGGASHKNNPAAADIYNPITSQADPLFNSLGDTCLQIGYPCDSYGSVCASQKTLLFQQARKAETSGRCKCRPGFFEVETACNRPPIFLKLPYKFHLLSTAPKQTVGIIRAKDPDNNSIDLQLSTSEFTLSSTGELLSTQIYTAPKTVTFSAVVTDNYGSESIVPVTVTIAVPPGLKSEKPSSNSSSSNSSSNTTERPFNPDECESGAANSMDLFFRESPDASAFLLGPFQHFQTYLLFAGPYVVEYVFDWNTTDAVPAMRLQSDPAPDLIASYFNLTVEDPTNVSVLFSYSSLAAGGDTFLLNLILNISGEVRQLRCSTDAATSTRAVLGCQMLEPELGGHFKLPGTAATSQLFIGDNQVYHFVVGGTTNQSLSLMDGNFTKTHQRNRTFLAGQTRIEKVTAVQLIQDQVGGGDSRYATGLLAVFGVGQEGNDTAVPYLGLAHLLLSGQPDSPLTPVNGQVAWIVEPRPLRQLLDSYW